MCPEKRIAKSLDPSLRKLVTSIVISHLWFFAKMYLAQNLPFFLSSHKQGFFGEKMEDSAALVLVLITLFSYT